VKSNGFAPPSPPPGAVEVAQPARPGQALRRSAGRPGHRAFFLGTRIEEAPHAPPVGDGAAPPPNPPPRPACRLPNALGQVGEQYGLSIAPFARARCPFIFTTFKAQGLTLADLFTFFNALQSHPAVVLFVYLLPKSTIPNAQHDLEGIL
jgi:hypothetical protein